jgi:hypothetical protein
MHKPKYAGARRLASKKDSNTTHLLSDFAEMHLAPGYRAYVRDDKLSAHGDRVNKGPDFAWRYLHSQSTAIKTRV